MPDNLFNDAAVALKFRNKEPRTMVSIDLVESVRLIEADEANAVQRWRSFVNVAHKKCVERFSGRIVKFLGDGLLLEFLDANSAVNCAFEMNSLISEMSSQFTDIERMQLRTGIHSDEVYIFNEDVYGKGVNLTARLASLANPGEVIVSSAVHSRITDGLDADLEDLGDCYLKHISLPVRAYRVHPIRIDSHAESRIHIRTGLQAPMIAVIPFHTAAGRTSHRIYGDIIADSLICALSRVPTLSVVSRLSTNPFRDRELVHSELASHLKTTYALTGSILRERQKIVVNAELTDARTGALLWAERFVNKASDLLLEDGEIVGSIGTAVVSTIFRHESTRLVSQPLPTLESFALLIGAISMMHRQSKREFSIAKSALEELAHRHPRLALPRAWLATWHALCVSQGWSAEPKASAVQAMTEVNKALGSEPDHSIALTVRGLVQGYLNNDLSAAEESYRLALDSNPNESMAWLYTATVNAWKGRGIEAEHAASQAIKLSPLDPLRYYYDSLAGTAMLAAGKLEQSIALSKKSIRANRAHASTYRMLAVAEVLSGAVDDAKTTVKRLLEIDPGFTVSRFSRTYPGRDGPNAETYYRALATAGTPIS